MPKKCRVIVGQRPSAVKMKDFAVCLQTRGLDGDKGVGIYLNL
jgi:hypothetical protein